MCAQALDAKITAIAPWRDPEFIEKFKVRRVRHLCSLLWCVLKASKENMLASRLNTVCLHLRIETCA